MPAREFGHDLPAMARAVRPDTRLMFIANPNNPTGTFIDGATLETFIAQLPREVLIVIGLVLAIPFAWQAGGGTPAIMAAATTPAGLIGFSGMHEAVSYTDFMLLLILGGIPWNVYFQRVLATPCATVAVRLSVGGGFL